MRGAEMFTKGQPAVLLLLFSLLAGAIWGGAIGFVIPQNRWEVVPMAATPGSAASVALPPQGVRLSVPIGDQNDDAQPAR